MDVINIEKRQRLIEMIIFLGSFVGVLMAVFQMSVYVLMIFPVFIFFSFIYFVSTLENYEKPASNFFISFIVSMSFSSLFIILLTRGLNGVNAFEIGVLTTVFSILAFLLTIELSGYSIDVKVVKVEKKKE